MLRLIEFPSEPYWLDLVFGVRARVRPLTAIEYNTARARNITQLREILKERKEIEEMGGTVEGLPDISDEAAQQGYAQFLFAVALAQSGVVEIEGLGDADGQPVEEVTDDIIVRWMKVPTVADDFIQQYTAPLNEVMAEGEASPTDLNGTTEVGQDIATSAEQQTFPAVEEKKEKTGSSARTSKTRSKRSKASTSGS